MTTTATGRADTGPTATGHGDPLMAADATKRLLAMAGVGAAVSLLLGTYANVHTPTLHGIFAFGFPAVLPMKAWFTTVAAALAIAQVASALWMYGRLPVRRAAPTWIGAAHRWLGTAAFVATLPVAYHCLWALGFKSTDTRVLVHSIAGCAFYGVFTTKMLVLKSSRPLPRLALPIGGAVLFTLLVLLWLTSSLWFFRTIGFPGV